MKLNNTIKIVTGSLILIIIIAIIWGIGANNRITKLQQDYNVSQGKILVYEQQALQLTDSINRINKSYILLQKNTDSLTKVYNKKVSDRDAIISKYKKEHQAISSLTGLQSIEYFNAKINSTSPVIITSVIPDTSFNIPVKDVRAANSKFIENDELTEVNENLRQSETSLLKINEGLKLEVNNRQSAVDKLTTLNDNKDEQIVNYKKEVQDLNKINKKQKRKGTFQKIGIGAAGVIAVILTLTL